MIESLLRRPLGRTGLAVTELGFGASVIAGKGRAVTPEDAAATVAEAWERGIRYFDTAPHYGLGVSEQRLGRALAGCPRAEFVLSTKVGRRLVPNPAPSGRDVRYDVPDDLMRQFDFTADGVRRSLDESIGRLGLSAVDVVYVHDPHDYVDQAILEAIPALCRLRDQGVVRAIGVGINDVGVAARFVREADIDVVMLAERLSLIDRTGADLVKECAARNVAVVSAAPFNSGLLARADPRDDATVDNRTADGIEVATARLLARICREFGTTLPIAAIQFALRSAEVSSVVAGLRSVVQVTAAAAHIGESLPDELWRRLDEAVVGEGAGIDRT